MVGNDHSPYARGVVIRASIYFGPCNVRIMPVLTPVSLVGSLGDEIHSI